MSKQVKSKRDVEAFLSIRIGTLLCVQETVSAAEHKEH